MYPIEMECALAWSIAFAFAMQERRLVYAIR